MKLGPQYPLLGYLTNWLSKLNTKPKQGSEEQWQLEPCNQWRNLTSENKSTLNCLLPKTTQGKGWDHCPWCEMETQWGNLSENFANERVWLATAAQVCCRKNSILHISVKFMTGFLKGKCVKIVRAYLVEAPKMGNKRNQDGLKRKKYGEKNRGKRGR